MEFAQCLLTTGPPAVVELTVSLCTPRLFIGMLTAKLVGYSIRDHKLLTKTSRFADAQSLREIHRVLKPKGGLGLIWNMEDYNSPFSLQVQTKREEQLHEVVWALDDGHPRFKSELWQFAFENSATEGLFCLPLNLKTWSQTQHIDAVEIENRIFSYCMLQSATPDKREWYRQQIRCILQNAVVENQQGSHGLQMHFSTIVAWTLRPQFGCYWGLAVHRPGSSRVPASGAPLLLLPSKARFSQAGCLPPNLPPECRRLLRYRLRLRS